MIWSWPGVFLGRSFWITAEISAEEIGLVRKYMDKDVDKNEITKYEWHYVGFMLGWREKIEDRWVPKRLAGLACFKSVMASNLSGILRI